MRVRVRVRACVRLTPVSLSRFPRDSGHRQAAAAAPCRGVVLPHLGAGHARSAAVLWPPLRHGCPWPPSRPGQLQWRRPVACAAPLHRQRAPPSSSSSPTPPDPPPLPVLQLPAVVPEHGGSGPAPRPRQRLNYGDVEPDQLRDLVDPLMYAQFLCFEAGHILTRVALDANALSPTCRAGWPTSPTQTRTSTSS
jgi:hypothetical protein